MRVCCRGVMALRRCWKVFMLILARLLSSSWVQDCAGFVDGIIAVPMGLECVLKV